MTVSGRVGTAGDVVGAFDGGRVRGHCLRLSSTCCGRKTLSRVVIGHSPCLLVGVKGVELASMTL